LFPTGGKNLYELLRSDYEPVFIDVFAEEECQRSRVDMEGTLTYRRSFDPMLYFWPVEGQHVVAHFERRPAELDRLVKALQRDGAVWITAIYKKDKIPVSFYSPEWNRYDDADCYAYEHWGDSDGFMLRRYGPAAVDPLAVPGRGSGADHSGAGAVPPHPSGLPDGQR
jgi:hypothetical protein